MSSNSFENYKFVMLNSSSSGRHKTSSSRERERPSSHKYSSSSSSRYDSAVHRRRDSASVRSRSPLPGRSSSVHVYRGGVRQYPKSTAHIPPLFPSSRGSSSRGGGLRGSSRGGWPPRGRGCLRGGYRGRGGPLSPRTERFSARIPARVSLRGRGYSRAGISLRGSSRGSIALLSRDGSGAARPRRVVSVSPVRKAKHPLPYAVSPVRAEVDAPVEEVLTKGELMKRMKEAKDADNLDELYRYRELYKELLDKGESAIKLDGGKHHHRSNNNNDNDFDEMDSLDLEEVECIETLEGDDECDISSANEDESREKSIEAKRDKQQIPTSSAAKSAGSAAKDGKSTARKESAANISSKTKKAAAEAHHKRSDNFAASGRQQRQRRSENDGNDDDSAAPKAKANADNGHGNRRGGAAGGAEAKSAAAEEGGAITRKRGQQRSAQLREDEAEELDYDETAIEKSAGTSNESARQRRSLRKRQRRRSDDDELSYGESEGEEEDLYGEGEEEEEEEEEEEQEAEFLQFAEDSVDVETMVEASSRRSDAAGGGVADAEDEDFMNAMLNESGGAGDGDMDAECSEDAANNRSSTRTLLPDILGLVRARLAAMSGDKQRRLHRRLLTHHSKQQRAHTDDDDAGAVEEHEASISDAQTVAVPPSILPILMRAIICALADFHHSHSDHLSPAKSVFPPLNFSHYSSDAAMHAKVREVMAAIGPQLRLLEDLNTAESLLDDATRRDAPPSASAAVERDSATAKKEWSVECDNAPLKQNACATEKCLTEIVGVLLKSVLGAEESAQNE